MKKRILALTLGAVMLFGVFALAACDGGASGDQIELRVLNYFDASGAGAMEELDEIWKAFEDAHPHIKLIREDEFEDPFHQKVEAYAAAGTLPDVMYAWPSGRSTTLHTQGLLKDLTPLIEKDGLKSKYIPLVMDPSNQSGNYIGILSQGVTATNMMMVNNEILEEVGLTPAKTYSELVAQVPVLSAAGYETIIMPNESTWVMQSCLFSLIAGRFMGENWDEQIHAGTRDFSDPAFLAALEFVQKMYDDGVIQQSSLAIEYGAGPGLFAQNKGAYYIDGDWRLGAFITDKTTGEALIDPARQGKFSVTVFPEIDLPGVAIPARTNSAVLGTGWGMNANIEAGSDLEAAAWDLIKWLVGEEVQSFRLRTGGITAPSWVGIDLNSLPLEPLQVAMAHFGGEFDRTTVVIDGAFDSPVYTPLNDGLAAIGLGTQTPAQVASLVQAAWETWKAAN